MSDGLGQTLTSVENIENVCLVVCWSFKLMKCVFGNENGERIRTASAHQTCAVRIVTRSI